MQLKNNHVNASKPTEHQQYHTFIKRLFLLFICTWCLSGPVYKVQSVPWPRISHLNDIKSVSNAHSLLACSEEAVGGLWVASCLCLHVKSSPTSVHPPTVVIVLKKTLKQNKPTPLHLRLYVQAGEHLRFETSIFDNSLYNHFFLR